MAALGYMIVHTDYDTPGGSELLGADLRVDGVALLASKPPRVQAVSSGEDASLRFHKGGRSLSGPMKHPCLSVSTKAHRSLGWGMENQISSKRNRK